MPARTRGAGARSHASSMRGRSPRTPAGRAQPVADLEAAWSAVHEALPAGWSVMRPSRHPERQERPWHVYATDLRVRTKRRDYIQATGSTEAEALSDLAGLLRGWRVEQVVRLGGRLL